MQRGWLFALPILGVILSTLFGWMYDVLAYTWGKPTITGFMRSHPLPCALFTGGMFGAVFGLAMGHLFGRGMPGPLFAGMLFGVVLFVAFFLIGNGWAY